MPKFIFNILLLLCIAFPISGKEYIVKFRNIPNLQTNKLLQFKSYSVEEIPFISNQDKFLKNNYDLLLVDSLNALIKDLSRYFLIKFQDSTGEDKIYELLSSPEIEYFEPNFKVKIEQESFSKEQYFSKQWYLHTIRIFQAWKKSTGKGIRIGVVDTGIDFRNSDLKSQIWINEKEDINHSGRFEPWDHSIIIDGQSGDLNGVDDDGNGFVDDVVGYDFVNQSYGNFGDFNGIDPIPEDENGHGTMVASVIAGARNDTGIVGVAPNSKIVVLRAFDLAGNAEISNIASAIVYSGLNKINILNFSFGSTQYSRLLHDAVKFAKANGCIMVASAGNDGLIEEHYPSNFPEVISVGATTPENKIGATSNYGPFVDIYAPGYQIFASGLGGNYRYVNGTSFSAPIISAICALLLEVNPTLSTEEIRSILQATQRKIDGRGANFNSGIVNATEALDFARGSIVDIKLLNKSNEISTKQKKISFLLSVYSPFAESFDLNLFGNDSILVKNLFFRESQQFFNDTISIDISDFKTGDYTLKLVAKLRNGNFVERNLKFLIFNEDSAIVLKNFEFFDATFENRIFKIYISTTNFPTYCEIFLYRGEEIVSRISDNYYGVNHFIAITPEINHVNTSLLCIVLHKTKWGKEIVDSLRIDFSGWHSNLKEFQSKYNPLPISYVFPKAINTANGRFILLNAFDNLNWGKLYAYKFTGNSFIPIDSLSESWIPIDTGDVDNDGIPELLLTQFGKTRIIKIQGSTSKFFSDPIYTSKIGETQWASQIVDLDNDGKLEVITFNEFKISVSKYFANKLHEEYFLSIPDTFGSIGTKPNIFVSDLDNNGKVELIFVTTRGFLMVFEFQKETQTFLLKYKLKLTGDQSSILISSIKRNSKLGNNILILKSIKVQDGAEQTGAYWELSEITPNTNDSLIVRVLHRFYGVRIGAVPQGYFFRNGLQSSDVDNDGNEEILVSIFPNLYLLKMFPLIDSLSLIAYLPFVYSNAVIAFDFNSNDSKEIGISTWSSFSFFELQTERILSKPQFADGWIDVNDSLHLIWQNVSNATSFDIFEFNAENNTLNFLANTTLLQFTEDKSKFVGSDKLVFLIRAIDDNGLYQNSIFSEPVTIFLNKRTFPTDVRVINPTQVEVVFSGKLPIASAFIKNVNISNESGEVPKVSSVQRVSDTLLVILLEEELPVGRYKLEIISFRDYYGNFTFPEQFDFEITQTKVRDTLLILKQITFIEPLKLILEFSEKLDSNSAISLKNYQITPFGKLSSVEFLSQYGNQVLVEISQEPNILFLGMDFYLNLSKIYSFDSSKWVSPPFNKVALTRDALELNNAFAYPNPLRLNIASVLTFANIPQDAKIELFNSRMVKIAEIDNVSWKGGISLDLEFLQMETFDSGIYYFRVTKILANGTKISSAFKKFSVVR